MNLRLALSRLESAEAREGTARTLAILCALGYVVSLSVMFATGMGLQRWLFVLLVWVLLVYLPLRILLEAFQTIAPAIRRTLVLQAATDPARYRSGSSIELVIDGLYGQEVLMPRIAKPQDGQKARDASAAVLRMANRRPQTDVAGLSLQCLGTVDQWVTDLSAWAQSKAPQNIQARWTSLRALASFAALTKVLGAVADQSGSRMAAPGPRRDLRDYLDACLDYCDRLALEVDATPWTEAPLGISVSADDAAAIRMAWTAYVQTPPPAIEARNNFVKTLLREHREQGEHSVHGLPSL